MSKNKNSKKKKSKKTNSENGKGKVYVLDTSIFIEQESAIDEFSADGNTVVVPIQVVEELDNAKNDPRPDKKIKAEAARHASRSIDYYRNKTSLKSKHSNKEIHLRDGIETKTGGKLYVDNGENIKYDDLPCGFQKTNDNGILLTARKWAKKNKKTSLVSMDTNLRIKADSMGIKVEEYESSKSIAAINELYLGRCEIDISCENFEDLKKKFEKVNYTFVDSKDVCYINTKSIVPNQCIMITNTGNMFNYMLLYYKHPQCRFAYIPKPKHREENNTRVKPVNIEQAFAYALIKDSDIKLVTLVGKAGTGKGLISLLASYEQVGEQNSRYERIVVFRPIIQVGKEIGFLPGTIEEKFKPWASPIIDNLTWILGENKKADRFNEKEKNNKNGNSSIVTEILDKYFTIKPFNFERGSSIYNSLIIVDEVQNLTKHEAKTIVTRAGEGSKVVLMGDPGQIDNMKLDATNNGLIYIVSKFKGQNIYGHMTLVKSERSELAELAGVLL